MKIDEMNQQIEELIASLTLEEKSAMIHGDALFYSGSVERLGIPPIHMSDGPMGVRNEFPRASWVPVGNTDDYVTYCVSNSAVAASWNREIAYEAGQVLGEEARGRGKDMILGPGINIKRIPANGRNFEYMSEDPYLTAELVVPMVKGIQESDVAACVKHFALNNQETERLWVNVEIDERALREIYLPGFEAAVKEGKTHAIMGAYNLLRKTHCCENQYLLDQILREEWGFDGVVVSDWGAVHHTKEAAKASLDLEMNVSYDFDSQCLGKALVKAVQSGEVDEADIDRKIRHLLLLMFRLKMLQQAAKKAGMELNGTESDTSSKQRKAGCYNTEQHREKVLHAAEESIVLLKNEEHLLPLNPENLQELLVIGDNANRLQALGGGSAEIKALYEISPLMGLKSQLGGNTKVTYAKGYYVNEKTDPESAEDKEEVSWQEASTQDDHGQSDMSARRKDISKLIQEKQKNLREEAVALAAKTKNVILVAGLNHDYDVEGFDREDMKLPYAQDELISEVLEANPNTIIVMMAGNAVSMGQWKEKAKAIVWKWYDGMEGGNALAGVLLGKVNPSGKLPESIPYKMEDCGALALGEYPGRPLLEEEKSQMDAHTTETYRDGIYVGYRYYEKFEIPVQFCFGHGLSYTEFSYANATVTRSADSSSRMEDVAAAVCVDVTNCGDRTGKEIVQLYIGKKDSSVERPVKELRGFEKIELAPGETKTVRIPLTNRAFSYYNVEQKKFVVEPGEYQIYVGQSLQNIKEMLSLEF